MITEEYAKQETIDWKNDRYKARYEVRRLRSFLQEIVEYGVPIRHEFFRIGDTRLNSENARLLTRIRCSANAVSLFFHNLDDPSSVSEELEIQLQMESQLSVCVLDDLIQMIDKAIEDGNYPRE